VTKTIVDARGFLFYLLWLATATNTTALGPVPCATNPSALSAESGAIENEEILDTCFHGLVSFTARGVAWPPSQTRSNGIDCVYVHCVRAVVDITKHRQ
jgi:hypothetical protein